MAPHMCGAKHPRRTVLSYCVHARHKLGCRGIPLLRTAPVGKEAYKMQKQSTVAIEVLMNCARRGAQKGVIVHEQ